MSNAMLSGLHCMEWSTYLDDQFVDNGQISCTIALHIHMMMTMIIIMNLQMPFQACKRGLMMMAHDDVALK